MRVDTCAVMVDSSHHEGAAAAAVGVVVVVFVSFADRSSTCACVIVIAIAMRRSVDGAIRIETWNELHRHVGEGANEVTRVGSNLHHPSRGKMSPSIGSMQRRYRPVQRDDGSESDQRE